MWKALAIFILANALVFNSGQKKDGANLAQQNAENHNAPATLTPVVNNKTATPENQSARPESPHWYQRPEWWLCIFAVPSLGLIWWQAKATANAAKAALLNAQAVINAERPWIIVEFEDITGVPSTIHTTLLKGVNKGRTPAKMIEGHSTHEIGPVGFRPPDDYTAPFVAPNQNLTVQGDWFPIWPLSPEALITPAERYGGVNPTFLYVYGRILYWGTFEDPQIKPYETRWCFIYNPHTRSLGRAPGTYAQNT